MQQVSPCFFCFSVHSTSLYAAPARQKALACGTNRERVSMTYCLVTLKVCSAFRIISGETAGEGVLIYLKKIQNTERQVSLETRGS